MLYRTSFVAVVCAHVPLAFAMLKTGVLSLGFAVKSRVPPRMNRFLLAEQIRAVAGFSDQR